MSDNREARPRATASAAVFAALLALQVCIPLLRLGSERSTRFGWQMFATLSEPVQFTVRYRSGLVDTIDVADHVVKGRSEIDLSAVLPPHLCRRLEGADAVMVRRGWTLGPPVERRCP